MTIRQASSQPCPESKEQSCCSDGYGLNYTLPLFGQCLTTRQEDGSMVQTIPKLIPAFSLGDTQCRRKNKHGIPPGTRVCRVPDCMKEPCSSGWCEETMTGFHCHVLESNVTPRNTTTLSSDITTSTGPSSSPESDSSTTTLEPVARCPDDWVEGRISNKCYLLDPEGSWVSWYQARNICADINVTNPKGRVIHAQLLVLESNDEMLELRQNLIDSFELWYDRLRNSDRVWLNCNDMEKEGTYYCDTNGESIPMQYFSKCSTGMPGNQAMMALVTIQRTVFRRGTIGRFGGLYRITPVKAIPKLFVKLPDSGKIPLSQPSQRLNLQKVLFLQLLPLPLNPRRPKKV
ncbi:uncharacterized protein LOC115924184 [Strongylocentrotus purpuratus]|uniref:C-type lectin domain-containing protein n=1 Tax=Strongylocentrotus purpuratus TaxID=7668 RepID=A0A7M7NUG3_STRPU|nr:uncharacterized protein LOC115924184 [Strongylocentrotus purpuratus]